MSTVVTVTKLVETTDRFGDASTASDGAVAGCFWWPTTTTEAEDGQSQVITSRDLAAPTGHGITSHHRLRFPDASVWRVVGDPEPWQSPMSGWAPGDVIHLEQVRG